jgi:hypothetical protein
VIYSLQWHASLVSFDVRIGYAAASVALSPSYDMRRNDRGQKREPDAFFSLTSDQFMVLDRLLDVLGLFACVLVYIDLAWLGLT